MKKLSLIFLLPLLVFCSFQTVETPKTKITFTYTRSYCGGAKPPQELLEQLKTPQPLANCKIMLVHENNKALKGPIATTNEKGEAEISLPKKGTYYLYLASNKKNKATLPFNKKCRELLKRRLGSFMFDGKETSADFYFPCDPCDATGNKRP